MNGMGWDASACIQGCWLPCSPAFLASACAGVPVELLAGLALPLWLLEFLMLVEQAASTVEDMTWEDWTLATGEFYEWGYLEGIGEVFGA